MTYIMTIVTAEKILILLWLEWDFVLSMHYNGANSYLFVNGTEIHKFKANDSEIVPVPLCLGNVTGEFSWQNMKKMSIGISSAYFYFHCDNEFFNLSVVYLRTMKFTWIKDIRSH